MNYSAWFVMKLYTTGPFLKDIELSFMSGTLKHLIGICWRSERLDCNHFSGHSTICLLLALTLWMAECPRTHLLIGQRGKKWIATISGCALNWTARSSVLWRGLRKDIPT